MDMIWDTLVMALLALFTLFLYLCFKYEYIGYAILIIGSLAKVVVWATGIEPLQLLVVLKFWSMIPFTCVWQCLRFHPATDGWLKVWYKAFPVAVFINIVEPAIVQEIPAGLYVQGINGLFMGVLSILKYYGSHEAVSGNILYGPKDDWTVPILYTVWNLVVFYALEIETQVDESVGKGNYFLMNMYSLAVPLTVSYFSVHGPREWLQARSFCLPLRLFQLTFFVSKATGNYLSPHIYHDIYNDRFHKAMQLFLFLMFLATFAKQLQGFKPFQTSRAQAFTI